LEYNRPDPILPDLIVCRKDLANRLLDAISRAG
jgi:3'(2'), 5'-bisphosphate nucleotidase